MQEFQKSKERPYIHLVDGGVSDNLGMRAILEGLEELEASPAFRSEVGLQGLRRLVIIVVNSRSSPGTDWDKGERAPGVFGQLLQSSSVPIDRYSYESVELLKDMAHGWTVKRELLIARGRLAGQSEAAAAASVPNIDVFAIDVSFDSIDDPKERAYFLSLPTTFYLPPQDIDRLRSVAGQLLRQSGDYQKLLKQLSATPPR
jgi:NTE family protein